MSDYSLLFENSLTSDSTQINTGASGIDAKDYLQLEVWARTAGGNINCNLVFNNDTAQKYSIREQIDDTTASTNVNLLNSDNLTGTVNGDIYCVVFIVNKSDEYKLFYSQGQERPASSGNAGNRKIITGMYENDSAAITQISANSSANWGAGSYMRIWGANA